MFLWSDHHRQLPPLSNNTDLPVARSVASTKARVETRDPSSQQHYCTGWVFPVFSITQVWWVHWHWLCSVGGSFGEIWSYYYWIWMVMSIWNFVTKSVFTYSEHSRNNFTCPMDDLALALCRCSFILWVEFLRKVSLSTLTYLAVLLNLLHFIQPLRANKSR